VDWLFELLAAPTLAKPLAPTPLIASAKEMHRHISRAISSVKSSVGLVVPEPQPAPVLKKRRKHAELYLSEDGRVVVPDAVRLHHYRAVKSTQSLLQGKLQAWRAKKGSCDIEGAWEADRAVQVRPSSAVTIAVAPMNPVEPRSSQIDAKLSNVFDQFMRDFSDQRNSLTPAETVEFDERWG
jgi:hypothetical protein